MSEKILTIAEAAAMLRADDGAVRGMIERGELPAAKAGEDWRIRRRDIDALFAVGGTPAAPEDVRLLVPIAEAAAMLSIGTKLIWRLVGEGKLKYARIGRRIFFRPETLAAFARDQEAETYRVGVAARAAIAILNKRIRESGAHAFRRQFQKDAKNKRDRRWQAWTLRVTAGGSGSSGRTGGDIPSALDGSPRRPRIWRWGMWRPYGNSAGLEGRFPMAP